MDRREWRAGGDSNLEALYTGGDGTKYIDDLDRLKAQLEAVYRKCMLEETIPDTAPILRCFLSGNFRYYTNRQFPVASLRNFITLLKSTGHEKQRIILSNLHTRMDRIERKSDRLEINKAELDDDIPF